jgi:glyoxylase-like metal-dependent hydrolase (beta-lactamase superfamily II)
LTGSANGIAPVKEDTMTDTTLSRRDLLAGSSAIAAAGLLEASLLGSALPANAKAPQLKTQAPAFYRFNIGGIEATVVSDGVLVGVTKTTFVGPQAGDVEKMMTDLFLPADKFVMDENALVINTGDKLALFETGMASVVRNHDMGLLVDNLKAAGIDPADIDYLIPSHGHIDHIGGILAADGSRNFPNAQIYISQADLEFWTNETLAGTPAEGSMRAARKNLLPNRDRILFYSDGKEVIPGVQAMSTPGHTVGHTCFVINSGADTLFFAGDLAHHNIIIENPRLEDIFDTDRQLGIKTRLKTMDMLAGERLRSLVYHLPWPGLGHFVKRGDGFHFEPEPIKFV